MRKSEKAVYSSYVPRITRYPRSHDLQPFTEARSLTLLGYLVFTGEPHLVIFSDKNLSEPVLGRTIFASGDNEVASEAEKRVNFGSWLIDHIGHYVNRHYSAQFPTGVNINFAQFDQTDGELVYRCFERGINHETLVCGTGALAVAFVFDHLHADSQERITVAAHRCNWYHPNVRIWVEKTGQGWLINGRPTAFAGCLFQFRQKNRPA